MEFTINLADKLDPVAIYAAVVSTLFAIWEVVKWWRQGPKLRGSISPNMIMMGGSFKDDNTYLTFDITNVGTEKTTITGVGLFGFAGWWSWIRKKPSRAAVVNHSFAPYTVPSVLNVGERFMSRCIQEREVEQWSRDHWLYAVIWHTFSERPHLIRIKPILKSKDAAPAGADKQQ